MYLYGDVEDNRGYEAYKRIQNSLPYLNYRLKEIEDRNQAYLFEHDMETIKACQEIANMANAEAVYGVDTLESIYQDILDMAKRHPMKTVPSDEDFEEFDNVVIEKDVKEAKAEPEIKEVKDPGEVVNVENHNEYKAVTDDMEIIDGNDSEEEKMNRSEQPSVKPLNSGVSPAPEETRFDESAWDIDPKFFADENSNRGYQREDLFPERSQEPRKPYYPDGRGQSRAFETRDHRCFNIGSRGTRDDYQMEQSSQERDQERRKLYYPDDRCQSRFYNNLSRESRDDYQMESSSQEQIDDRGKPYYPKEHDRNQSFEARDGRFRNSMSGERRDDYESEALSQDRPYYTDGRCQNQPYETRQSSSYNNLSRERRDDYQMDQSSQENIDDREEPDYPKVHDRNYSFEARGSRSRNSESQERLEDYEWKELSQDRNEDVMEPDYPDDDHHEIQSSEIQSSETRDSCSTNNVASSSKLAGPQACSSSKVGNAKMSVSRVQNRFRYWKADFVKLGVKDSPFEPAKSDSKSQPEVVKSKPVARMSASSCKGRKKVVRPPIPNSAIPKKTVKPVNGTTARKLPNGRIRRPKPPSSNTKEKDESSPKKSRRGLTIKFPFSNSRTTSEPRARTKPIIYSSSSSGSESSDSESESVDSDESTVTVAIKARQKSTPASMEQSTCSLAEIVVITHGMSLDEATKMMENEKGRQTVITLIKDFIQGEEQAKSEGGSQKLTDSDINLLKRVLVKEMERLSAKTAVGTEKGNRPDSAVATSSTSQCYGDEKMDSTTHEKISTENVHRGPSEPEPSTSTESPKKRQEWEYVVPDAVIEMLKSTSATSFNPRPVRIDAVLGKVKVETGVKTEHEPLPQDSD